MNEKAIPLLYVLEESPSVQYAQFYQYVYQG